MEFLGGEAMNERVARGAIPPAETAEIADQICRALGAAHDKGIVHRDLKPHNVQLLPTTSGRTHVKLLDFGVAKIMNAGDLSQSVKTRVGTLMGTPIYMSPEQCKGAGDIDHRTDIYSLGVMLYEMLAGRPPFIATGVGELFAMHMLQSAPPVTDFAPQTPAHMAAAVMKSLAKDPRDRFASMEELREAFLADGLPLPAAGRTQSYRSRPGATKVVPTQASSTTLSASPGQIEGDAAPARRGRSGLVIVALALAASGAAATYLFVVKGGKSAGGAASGDSEANPPSATAPAPTPAGGKSADSPAVSKTLTSKTVTIRFESDPPGAHVVRASDDKELGVVPFELKLPRAGGKPEYLFRLDGYRDQILAIELGSDQTLRAKLEKLAPEPAPAAAAPPPTPAEPPARKPATPRPRRAPRPTIPIAPRTTRPAVTRMGWRRPSSIVRLGWLVSSSSSTRLRAA